QRLVLREIDDGMRYVLECGHCVSSAAPSENDTAGTRVRCRSCFNEAMTKIEILIEAARILGDCSEPREKH
ncbi:MAG: hypothetical protein V4671_16700, partial [Armatimonadota bacterium]